MHSAQEIVELLGYKQTIQMMTAYFFLFIQYVKTVIIVKAKGPGVLIA
jgi:hypothetical protein